MLLDGKKVACATCIKGHRATHCKHMDRPLVEIKKIGRPTTQCERCRALRLVRQLHVKCNCSDEKPLKRTGPIHDDQDRKKRVITHLRTIAPRQAGPMDDRHQHQQMSTSIPIPSPSQSCCSSSSSSQQQPKNNNKVSSISQGTINSSPTLGSSCCTSQSIIGNVSPSSINKTTIAPSSSSPALGASCYGSQSTIGNISPSSSSSSPALAATCCGSQSTSGNISPSSSSPTLAASCCGSQSTIGNKLSPSTNKTVLLPSSTNKTVIPSSFSSSSSSTCCPSTTSRNALGQSIRLVTCRCGDACTCIGCDAHPARAMKSYHDQNQQQHHQHQDPYAGYSDLSLGRRGLSIAAICQSTTSSSPPPLSPSPSSSSSSSFSSGSPLDDRPTSVLAENGALLCGCGCSHALDQCTDCFQELCQDYFASR